jgi:hypothetical protein
MEYAFPSIHICASYMIPQLSFKTRTNCNTGVSLSALNLNMGEK